MRHVLGIGGIFFKGQNPKQLYEWYGKHLGLKQEPGSGVTFPWNQADGSGNSYMTVWSIFPKDTQYFAPGQADFMANYIVDDLDALLSELRAEGVWIDERREEYPYGRFAWIMDPEGNRIELWEPPKPD